MNLTTLFDHQRAIDTHILAERPELQGVDLLPKKILALQTGLGKVSENWRGFMYWSDDQEPRKVEVSCMDDAAERLWCGTCHIDFPPDGEYERHEDLIGRLHSICPVCKNNILMGFRTQIPLLEEYVDCLRFILSIALELRHKGTDWQQINMEADGYERQNDITNQVCLLVKEVSDLWQFGELQWRDFFASFVHLGEMLGFSWEQIEKAYLAKNAVNHQRQEAGY